MAGVRVASEGPVKIGKATVEAAWKRRAAGQRLVIRDAACKGLALVVNPTGMAWRFSYKPRGVDSLTGKRFPSTDITIGTPASHSPEAARQEAGRLKASASQGVDLAAQRRAAIEAAAAKRATTAGRLFELYEKALPTRPALRGTGKPKPAHVKQELRHVRLALAEMRMADRPIADIDVQHVRNLLHKHAEAPATAKHRHGSLSRFFDWATEMKHLTVNPCAALPKSKKPRAAPPRERFLPVQDVAKLWKAAEGAEGLEPVHVDLLRFLMAVPARRIEAATMEWQHVKLDDAVWEQPAKLTKNGTAHTLPLNNLAMEILLRRWTEAGKPAEGLVFPSPRLGRVVSTWSDMVRALRAASGLTSWSLHDLRRSVVTALAENGVAEAVADGLLNHRQSGTRSGVLGVYQKAQHVTGRRKAMELWSDLLAAALEGKAPPTQASSNVISLFPKAG